MAAAKAPKSVIVLSHEDEHWTIYWSSMPLESVVYAHRLMGLMLDARINGDA
jgi:hypothetical protein